MSPLFLLLALAAAPHGGKSLAEGQKALADFRPEEAVVLLEKAKDEGPYGYADHAKLYEQLGIAYAYLDKAEKAADAFDTLLLIDPTWAISYTLSPKVTFVFEQARNRAQNRTPPTLQVSWRHDLKISEEVPIDLEVVEDPRAFLKHAELHYRLKNAPSYEMLTLDLPAPGERATALIPPLARSAATRGSVELYLTAEDARGNAVLLWGTSGRPREIPLEFEPPTPWYGHWWVWAIAGVAIAAGATAAAVAVTREPAATVPGTFEVGR
ncbi:MAG: hypothetical protein U1E65_03850 [Myxococcota bacterium]